MLEEIFLVPVKTMLSQAGVFVSAFCAVVLVLAVGWIIAKIVKNVVMRILDVLQLEATAERVGVDRILARGGIKYSITELIGVLSYWLVMLISFVIAISLVNLNNQAAGLLDSIVLYIPKVISVIFILILGMFFASFVNSAIRTAASTAGVEQAGLFGKVAQAVIIVFAVVISLKQLQIDIQSIDNALTIVLGSIGLAFALAFGLGCKDIAARYTQDYIDKLKSKK